MSILLLFDRIKERALRIYRKQVFLARIKSKKAHGLKILGKVYIFEADVTIGDNVNIWPNVMFHGNGKISIGNNVAIGNGTVIYAQESGGVTIGDNVSIAAQCYIIDSNHGIEKATLICKQHSQAKATYIGNDVWIAAGCKIVSGAKLNDGCVIGANSVVNSEIEANGVAVGSPARVIKYRT